MAYGSPNRHCCPAVMRKGATGAKRPFVFNKPPRRIWKRCLKPDVPSHMLSATSSFLGGPDFWPKLPSRTLCSFGLCMLIHLHFRLFQN